MKHRVLLASISALLVLQAGAAAQADGFKLPSLKMPAAASSAGSNLTKTLTQGAGCALGGGAAAFLAKNYADKDAKKLNLSKEDKKKRETGYMVGFGLLGCAGGAAIAGTAYDKMSAQGRKNRIDAIAKAAESGREQSYTDPENPSMMGRVTPGARGMDEATQKECVDTEDVWAEGSPAFSKVCRVAGTSKWEPATG